MLKKNLFSLLLATALCPAFAAKINPAPAFVQALPAQPIVLEAGTPVSVKLNQEIDANTVSPGNTLQFIVVGDVKVNGKTLILNGAYAEGTVENVVPGCDGKCSKLTIAVETAQAVDGQMVRLYGTPHVITTPCCNGGAAKAIIGVRMRAAVKDDITIKA